MMSFLLFLIVFVITYNHGTARPMIDSDFNCATKNGLEDCDGDEMLYDMPTTILPGTSIHIIGTLDTTADMFKIALIDDETKKEDCNITFDFNTQMISVSPAIEDYDTASYESNLQPGVRSTFSIRLIARVNHHGEEMMAVHFQVNEEGESPQLICDINYENIGSIEMQQGVARVDGLYFKFRENR